MPKTNKNGIFCPFRGKIDFEDMLILEKKQLKNLLLEQNIFSFAYFQLNFRVNNN